MKIIEYIKEINNELFLSGGLNKPINIYDANFRLKFSFNNFKGIDWIYNALILQNNIDKEIKLVFCCINCLYLSTLSLLENGLSNQKDNQSKFPSLFCLEIQKNQNDFIIFKEKEITKNSEIFSQILKKFDEPIYTGRVRSGVWIGEKILAFGSIDNLFNNKKEKNKVVIININNNKKLEIKINYTINLSQNSLASMEMVNVKNKKVLLFGCKKYIKGQKNGILIVNYQLNSMEDIEQVYFEKTNFEVYCFCQISKYESGNIFKINKIEKTDYFLVGGFDIKKRKGIIKLYKLIYEIDNDKIKIKYIDDSFINEKIFRGAISCIVQLKETGNILVGCWDGNIYIFSPPRFEIFENVDKIDLKI